MKTNSRDIYLLEGKIHFTPITSGYGGFSFPTAFSRYITQIHSLIWKTGVGTVCAISIPVLC